ncbi:MAG: CvpA family protein, partial [Leptotrichia wadei]
MILDIGFVALLIIFILLGYRRGFSLEFFNMFKYIFIIFITNYIYKFFLDSERIKPQNQLKIFIIIVVVQCIVYSAILIINKKFLRSIRIERFDKFSGMIFGMIKLFFVAIIIYI